MKIAARLGLAVALALGMVSFALTGEDAESVTLEGDVMCAKCLLEKADAETCQNVLVVKTEEATAEYYIVSNDVSEKFGHACQKAMPAKVTGTVAEKDGRQWITPSAMEEVKG